jgi:succinoglycan biosynthesis transport protein ExoP
VSLEAQPGPAVIDERPQPLPWLQYWFVLVRRRWLILAAVVLCLGAGTFLTLRQVKVYEASATMILEETTPRVVDKVNDVAEAPLDSDKFYNTQIRLIQSSSVAQRAAVALGLDRDPRFSGGETGAAARQAAGDGVLGCLSARAEKNSRVVTVSCTDTSPQRAARIANAVVQAYMDELQASRSHTTLDAVRFLGDQADELRVKLEKAERALFEFNERNDLLATNFEESHRILSSNLFRLNDELSRIRAEGIALGAQAEETRKARKTEDPAVAAALLGAGPALADLKHRRAELNKELTGLQARYKEGHPKVIEARASLAALDRNLKKELDQLYGGLDVKVRANHAQEVALTQAIDREMKRSLKLREKEVEYNRLRREVEQTKEVYALVARRLKETELTRPLHQSQVRPLEAAVVPGAPIRPNLRNNLLLAAVLGLLLGLGLAVGLELLDDSVRSPEDVEGAVGVPLLGLIPSIEPTRGPSSDAIERSRAEFLVHHPTSPVTEACHTVATNIFSLFLKTPPRVLMLASASPQQGKTLLTLSLANSVAARGRRVVVVDADLRRGRLHKVFGLPRQGGLYEILNQELPYQECLRETTSPNVSLLTAGSFPEKMNPLRVLELEDFARLAAQLRQDFDLVLFDTPPVGLVADAIHIGAVCDGAVAVARFRKASRRALRAAVQQLETSRVRVVGCVINDLDLRSHQYGYYRAHGLGYRLGYGYGYGYGYSAGPDQDDV